MPAAGILLSPTSSHHHHSQALCALRASPFKLISSSASSLLRSHHRVSGFQCDKIVFKQPSLLRTRSAVAMTASSLPPPTPAVDDAPQDLSSDAHILEPIRGEGDAPDALLYFLPGAFTASIEYLPILQGIQSKYPFRLWIALLDVGEMLINANMVESSFDGIIERLKKLGFNAGEGLQNIFVGGHSWGAWESRAFAMKTAKGYIQLASTFHSCADDLVQYPKPVLTICGERDGQITLAPVAKHAGDVHAAGDELGRFFVDAIKPVVIVPGMNHAQFSHGIPNRERGDLDATIAPEDAKRAVVDLVSAFLAVHTSGVGDGRRGTVPDDDDAALSVLAGAVRRTHDRFHTFWSAIGAQASGAKAMQLDVGARAGVAGIEGLVVGAVHHEYKDNFIYSKPSLEVRTRRRVNISTYFSAAGKHGILNNLWVKLKSGEALAAAFGPSDRADRAAAAVGSAPDLGAVFNRRAFDEALAAVPDDARRRFEAHGKKLRFVDDKVWDNSLDWIGSDLIFEPAHDCVDVRASVLVSPLHGIPERFAGMHYFKLLTVARAMEWILMDSLR